ncbi:hypothetical protein ACFP7A_01115 [Sporolactobacillus kofuensis]|uniref:Ribbon-helix-helix protein CopG domain-containing protein n=1 Tax=Sporolactobacillus kofuensis TaxID=269672 RepID=A0ABW1W9F3_9BACL|nr:hypothetical protein [Sporolactobacillus kofuensis]MCO7176998.1 hypothetical protein [Sporolactobacillus kofuensis]
MVEVIRIRLRKKKDDDLRVAFENINEDKSDLIRAALRAYLFDRAERPSMLVSRKPVLKLEKKEKPDYAVTDGLDDLLNNF